MTGAAGRRARRPPRSAVAYSRRRWRSRRKTSPRRMPTSGCSSATSRVARATGSGRLALQEAVDAIDDGLAADVVVSRLVRCLAGARSRSPASYGARPRSGGVRRRASGPRRSPRAPASPRAQAPSPRGALRRHRRRRSGGRLGRGPEHPLPAFSEPIHPAYAITTAPTRAMMKAIVEEAQRVQEVLDVSQDLDHAGCERDDPQGGQRACPSTPGSRARRSARAAGGIHGGHAQGREDGEPEEPAPIADDAGEKDGDRP